MAQNTYEETGTIEAFPETQQPSALSDELNRISELLQGEFPSAERISFEYYRKLRVHIDVRKREEISIVENRLPALGGGTLFLQATCGNTPGHPFMHRISAIVAR